MDKSFPVYTIVFSEVPGRGSSHEEEAEEERARNFRKCEFLVFVAVPETTRRHVSIVDNIIVASTSNESVVLDLVQYQFILLK